MVSSSSARRVDRKAMHKVRGATRPGELYRQFEGLATELKLVALSNAPAPVKPRVSRATAQAGWGHGEGELCG